MRKLTIILFILTIASCQTSIDKTKEHEAYQQGIKMLGQVDSTGQPKYIQALKLFDKAVEFDSNHIESWYWKSFCELKTGQLDKVQQTTKYVIEKFDKSNHRLLPAFYITAGLANEIRGNDLKSHEYFDKAISIYDSRLVDNNGDTDAIMNKAIVLCYMDKKPEAIKFMDSVCLKNNKNTIFADMKKQIIIFEADSVLTNLKNRNN